MKPWSTIVLTSEQLLHAIEEEKKRVWFREKHCEYWKEIDPDLKEVKTNKQLKK